MKKLAFALIATMLLLPVVLAMPLTIPASEKAKAPDLKKIVFIHYKKGFAKPVCDDGVIHSSEQCGEPGLPECPAGEVCINCKCVAEEEEEPTPTTTCYAFLGKYGKKYLQWRELPVDYTINPVNPVQTLDESFVVTAIFNGAEEWDYWTSTELMNDVYTIDYTATYGVQNYVNAIAFGDYPTEGVIAVTTVWYNPTTKTIVEFDVMFDTDWTWGDATTNPAVMDLQNIATHELGHGAGLADVYDAACSEVTMYGYSDYGEINKRTLEQPDITGIQALYGD